MKTVHVAKFLVLEQLLGDIGLVSHEIFVKVYIDMFSNESHVFWSQLHRISNQLNLSPEDIVVYFGQKEVVFLVSEL